MKKLSLEQMENNEGGKASPEFFIMCGILTAGLGIVTFGLGAVAGLGCWALGNF